MNNKSTKHGIALFITLAVLLNGCGPKGEKFGDAPADSLARTAVSSILKNPEKYMDKEVVIEGKIVSECPSGCFFNLRDNSGGTIFVELKGNSFIPLPQRTGRTAVVKGTVFQGQGATKETKVFAKGLTIK